MGREWYNGGRSCSSKSKMKPNEANGCITALSHFFHFHHFHFPSRHHHHQPCIDSHSRYPTGLVAPRNSLDLPEESPLSTNYKEKETSNITVSRTKSKLRSLLVDTSSDFCNSPRTKTPNVVARLMGLDLLPENLDVSTSSRNSVRGQRHSGNGSGSRSLPESPRVSSARKSDSDNRRLSLQINRENENEELGRWRLKELKQDKESPSPRHNGRQINERIISTRAGMDITNLLENTRGGAAAQNQIEHSRLSKKQNTTSSKPTFVFSQQNQTSQVQKLLSKDSKEKLNRVNEQPLMAINGWRKADSESKPSPNRNKQRKDLISISTQSDRCGLLEKKKCKKISVASSALSATERPRKQMKRAEEATRNADATICSGQVYKNEEKLPQEPPRKKLEEEVEVERVVAEIERHIVDSLVLEMIKTTSLVGSNA